MKRILFVGQTPETVDFADPALPPGFDAAKINAGIAAGLKQMEERGWIAHTVEPRPGAQDAKRYEVTEEGATVFLDWLTGPYVPPSRFQDPDLFVRLTFVGFIGVDQVIALLDTEIEARQRQVARYRHRDRRLDRTPTIGFDEALADGVSDCLHQMGTEAIDQHIAGLLELRRRLLDGLLPAPPGGPVPTTTASTTTIGGTR